MIEKFKKLSKGKKIIVGIIAFMLLPFVTLALGVELLVKGIKSKNIVKIVFGAFVAVFMITPSISFLNIYIDSMRTSSLNKPTSESVIETLDKNEEVVEEQDNQDNIENDEEIIENKNPFGNVMEKPVMNGSKTERIGTYAEVIVGGREITQENLIQFYKEVVKDGNYNWVTLNIDGETGIAFSGSSHIFTYGTIDNEACITEDKGTGFVYEDKVVY